MDRKILHPGQPTYLSQESGEPIQVFSDDLFRCRVDPVVDIILRGENVFQDVQDDWISVTVEVRIQGELIAFYEFLDQEGFGVQNLL